jgi:hypothetical protein
LPNEFHNYSYVANNPILYFDPSGLKKKSFWDGFKQGGPAGLALLGLVGPCLVEDWCDQLDEACNKVRRKCLKNRDRYYRDTGLFLAVHLARGMWVA